MKLSKKLTTLAIVGAMSATAAVASAANIGLVNMRKKYKKLKKLKTLHKQKQNSTKLQLHCFKKKTKKSIKLLNL